jgi:general L-amino acid transport system substrate-binding protein
MAGIHVHAGAAGPSLRTRPIGISQPDWRRYLSLLSMIIALFFIGRPVPAALAGDILARVKANGFVRCGSVARPGLATRDANGRWNGLEVDVCRAVAAAVLARDDAIAYHAYATPENFKAVRDQQDDVSFLTGTEIAEQKLAGRIVPGPTVFIESHAVMVPADNSARHLRDLAGESICYMIGRPLERSLEAHFDASRKGWIRRAFSEQGEMADTYQAQSCHAIAGEITTLAKIRLDPGLDRLKSRILPETLAAFPVMAVSGTGDAQWSAIVAWTVHTLISAERPQSRWYAGGAGAMPIRAAELGLEPDWQQRVLTSVGDFGQIFARHLGKNSALKIERGLNANQIHGGLLLSPFLE